jgi:hypothetical protein
VVSSALVLAVLSLNRVGVVGWMLSAVPNRPFRWSVGAPGSSAGPIVGCTPRGVIDKQLVGTASSDRLSEPIHL